MKKTTTKVWKPAKVHTSYAGNIMPRNEPTFQYVPRDENRLDGYSRGVFKSYGVPSFDSKFTGPTNPRTIALSLSAHDTESIYGVSLHMVETDKPAPERSTYKPAKVSFTTAKMYNQPFMFGYRTEEDDNYLEAWTREVKGANEPREEYGPAWNVFYSKPKYETRKTWPATATPEPAPVIAEPVRRQPRAKKPSALDNYTPPTALPRCPECGAIMSGKHETCAECREAKQAPAPAAIDPRAAVLAKYAWIERWEADPKKRMYKSTIQNGKVNRAAELAALPLDVTSEFQTITKKVSVA